MLDSHSESLRRFGNKAPPEDIMDRILSALRSEAQAVLPEGVAWSIDDINVVVVNGYGFPRWTGGPVYTL